VHSGVMASICAIKPRIFSTINLAPSVQISTHYFQLRPFSAMYRSIRPVFHNQCAATRFRVCREFLYEIVYLHIIVRKRQCLIFLQLEFVIHRNIHTHIHACAHARAHTHTHARALTHTHTGSSSLIVLFNICYILFSYAYTLIEQGCFCRYIFMATFSSVSPFRKAKFCGIVIVSLTNYGVSRVKKSLWNTELDRKYILL
jgi:hypothetical protein